MRAVTKAGAAEAETNLRAVVAGLAPVERERVLRAYITQLGVDAVDSRRKGWYDQANFLEELAHHMRRGHVIMAGDFRGLEHLLNVEARRVRDAVERVC